MLRSRTLTWVTERDPVWKKKDFLKWDEAEAGGAAAPGEGPEAGVTVSCLGSPRGSGCFLVLSADCSLDWEMQPWQVGRYLLQAQPARETTEFQGDRLVGSATLGSSTYPGTNKW